MISVIVPVYNAERYLKEMLDSILSQTYSEWKCILVNDGSTDGSQNLINEYCLKDSRFVNIAKKNEGSADLTRRCGMEFVETEYVVNIDADDIVEPDFIMKLVSRQAETGADCILGRIVGCTDGVSQEDWYVPSKDFDYSRVMSGREAYRLTIGSWQIPGCCCNLFRKALYELVDYGPHINSDEFTCRQILFNARTVAFSDAKYFYRDNIGTSSQVSKRIFSRVNVDQQLEDFTYKNYPSDLEKKSKITVQRFFNLVHFVDDFHRCKALFTEEESVEIRQLLKSAFFSLKRMPTIVALPSHSFFLFNSWFWFVACSRLYCSLKRVQKRDYQYK